MEDFENWKWLQKNNLYISEERLINLKMANWEENILHAQNPCETN